MRFYAGLMHGCGACAGAVIGIVTLLVGYDVIARNVGFGSLPWVLEITEYALPLATFLAAPWLMYNNGHVRLDVLDPLLPYRWRKHLAAAAAAVELLVSAALVWYAVAVLLDAKRAGAIVLKTLTFPEWWLFIPMPLTFALLALECARRLWVEVRTESHV